MCFASLLSPATLAVSVECSLLRKSSRPLQLYRECESECLFALFGFLCVFVELLGCARRLIGGRRQAMGACRSDEGMRGEMRKNYTRREKAKETKEGEAKRERERERGERINEGKGGSQWESEKEGERKGGGERTTERRSGSGTEVKAKKKRKTHQRIPSV